jgi:hypothetical protein
MGRVVKSRLELNPSKVLTFYRGLWSWVNVQPEVCLLLKGKKYIQYLKNTYVMLRMQSLVGAGEW